MKTLGLAVLGFLIALCCLSLFTPAGTAAILATYGILLYLLFFGYTRIGTTLLVGYTIGLELLSAHHFGTAAVTSVLFYGLYLLFANQLRFTSRYARFIVALLIGLVAASALLYPLVFFFQRLLIVAFLAFLLSICSALLHQASTSSAHELV